MHADVKERARGPYLQATATAMIQTTRTADEREGEAGWMYMMRLMIHTIRFIFFCNNNSSSHNTSFFAVEDRS